MKVNGKNYWSGKTNLMAVFNLKIMGKGDKKTRRGKIVNKTFGVRRPRPKHLRKKANAQKQAE